MIELSKGAAISINRYNKGHSQYAVPAYRARRLRSARDIIHSPVIILVLNIVCWSNLLLRLFKIYKNRLS